jgi:hypothetical protein
MQARYRLAMECFATKYVSAKSNFSLKTNVVISSIEFCQAIFDKSYIGARLGGGCGHKAMTSSR